MLTNLVYKFFKDIDIFFEYAKSEQIGLPDTGAANPGYNFCWFCYTGYQQLEKIFQHIIDHIFITNICKEKTQTDFNIIAFSL